MIRRKDRHGKLLLTDISSPDFNANSTGKTLDALMREIHGRYPDGTLVVGVEVFREIYQRIGFGVLVKPTRLPLVRNVLNLFYSLFAKIRFASAMRRIKKAERCGEACEMKTFGTHPEQ